MNRKLLDFGVPLVVLLLATALIAATGADLRVSAWFHRPGGWPVGDRFPWHQLYRWGYYPAYIIGFASLGVCLAGWFRPALVPFRRGAAYLVVLLLLGPGLLVNTVFKDHWGRPRPRQVVQFGGTMAFHHPWEPGEAGKGKSFPSGHGGAAFYLAMPYFVLRRRRPRAADLVFAAGMLYGGLMGIARISQGGHFVSDILWAWGVVHLTAVTLYYLMGLDREDSPPAAD
ncbi:MAG TPA: phosphatase PAP2 family protein [Desulfuromonadaceae bacterium]